VRGFSFWPFLFGVLVLVWGATTLVSRFGEIVIDVSWWALFSIVVGFWLLAYAVRKERFRAGQGP
jgi:hypothetical protein